MHTIVTLLFLLLLAKRRIAWVQPQIALHRGFVDIYSSPKDYVGRNDVVGGRQYSLDIFMDQTDRYDYLIQRCSYNNKYNFIDSNSCLICDDNFQRKWETDEYHYAGAGKRTVVHFLAPEPLNNIECRVRVIQCCGCAERACERNIWPYIKQFQQQIINVNLMGESSTLALHRPSIWPWWVWLLIALALLLLICLLVVPLLLFCCKHKFRKSAIVKSAQVKENGQETTVTQDGEVSFIPKPSTRRTRDVISEQRKERSFQTPSESPSESAQSTASHSRNALMVRQNVRTHQSACRDAQSGTATAKVLTASRNEHTSRSETELWQENAEFRRQPTRDQLRAGGYAQPRKHFEQRESFVQRQAGHSDMLRELQDASHRIDSSRLPTQRNTELMKSSQSAAHAARKRSTSQERFFQKNDRQRGLIEEGYDQAQYSFTAQKDANEEIV
ncbi:hypothetical protein Tcan_03730 [Toxocara canis]|uniref:Uncharacterized protein n=2 Tax=Toxocara canis TaxID=6265 RepID=A0A0B2UTD0_TOXCA|nr:hypothetical protein Tcan_03730 [Toxocara canis]VDM26485.1 unnamed protein product [Toxocara canis]